MVLQMRSNLRSPRGCDPEPAPEPGHLALDPYFACDHAPLIRFSSRRLLGGNICAAPKCVFSSFLRSKCVCDAVRCALLRAGRVVVDVGLGSEANETMDAVRAGFVVFAFEPPMPGSFRDCIR